MSYLPCENPSCNSYGKPHPNCRCHGDFAEGGEASFCAREREHQPGCKYFAEGGEAISPDDVTIDEPTTAGINPDDVVPDETDAAPEGINPDDVTADVPPATSAEETSSDDSGYSLPTSFSDAVSRIGGKGLLQTPDTQGDPGTPISDADRQKTMGQFEDNAAIGSLITGGGVVGLAGKAADAASTYARLGKVGSAALKGAITSGIIQGSDEISKAILGQGNPEAAVNPYLATGAAVLFGGALGGAGAKLAETAANSISGPLMARAANAEHFLAGVGHAANGGELAEGANKSFKAGFQLLKEKLPTWISKSIGTAIGETVGGTEGAIIGGPVIAAALKPIIAKVTNKASKYAVPATVRWLSEGAQGSLLNMIEYADRIGKGTSYINNTIDAVFKGGSSYVLRETKRGDIEKLRNYIDGGGMTQSLRDEMHEQHDVPGFAKGGPVEAPSTTALHRDHAHIAQNMPDQNIMLQTAKGRISSYLSGMRPQQDMPRLAFDDQPDTKEQTQKYEKALEIAVNPLSVMQHVQKGTVEPEHIAHLKAMYPELTGHLQQKVTERIVKDQMDGKKPKFATRQGLSLMMGTALSGEFTPQNIQAAQAVFANKKKPEPQDKGSGKPKSEASLTKSDQSYLTADQARQGRQQRDS